MYENLVKAARDAREKAHCPYSKFKVGAALLTDAGTIITGCNVENASYGLTNCAERTAIFKAVSEGEKNFKAIAIVLDGPVGAPCGACRQVIREFGEHIDVVMANLKNDVKIMKLGELLPLSFGPEFL